MGYSQMFSKKKKEEKNKQQQTQSLTTETKSETTAESVSITPVTDPQMIMFQNVKDNNQEKTHYANNNKTQR